MTIKIMKQPSFQNQYGLTAVQGQTSIVNLNAYQLGKKGWFYDVSSKGSRESFLTYEAAEKRFHEIVETLK